MAEITKFQFATLENLTLMKSLMDAETLKAIDEKVSPAIKTVSQSADKLKIYFYTKEAPVQESEAAFSVTLPAPVDISGKADKVANATSGNFAGLDANGNLTDSGKKAADFEAAGAATNAKTELLKLIGSIPSGSEAKTIIDYIQQVVADGGYDDSAVRSLIAGVQAAVDKLNGTGDGSVAKAVATLKTDLESKIGTLSTLNTAAKSNLVSAVNELLSKVTALETSSDVTIDTTTTTSGMSKSYTIKQGDTTVGTIDIPKDMVVKSGTVVKNPEGQPAGTYIELTLANAASDKIYVNVGTLVDIYVAEASAAKIQLSINPSTRVISGTIVAGSVTATELAANAVTTTKIADGNVTLAKLEQSIRTSLGKADTAVQKVITGTANGTISVDGTNVAVKGLGSAAYANTSAFDAAGSAKALADGAVKTNTTSIATNTAKITALENKVGSGFEPISEESIRALFS